MIGFRSGGEPPTRSASRNIEAAHGPFPPPHPHADDVGHAANPESPAPSPPLVADPSSYGGPVRSDTGAKAGSPQALQFRVMELPDGETLEEKLRKSEV